jgi:hypothetical protein
MTPEITQLWSNYQKIIGLWSILLKKITCVLLLQIFRRYASMINKMGIKALKELSPEALALVQI